MIEKDLRVQSPSISIEINSPINGKLISLNEVNDKVFASGILGKGIGIIPSDGKVYAPFDGIIRAIFPTKHAIGIASNENVEVLIHIGIDTVQLNGKYFETFVNEGDSVKMNQLLLEFDLQGLIEEGYDTVTPVIVTNSDEFCNIEIDYSKSSLLYGTPIIFIRK